MKARCAQCQNVFPVEGEGAQTCPRCGAVLYLDLPKPPASEGGNEEGSDLSGADGSGWTDGGSGAAPEMNPRLMPYPGPGADGGNGQWDDSQMPPPPNPNGPAFRGDAFSVGAEEVCEPTPWEQRASIGFFKGLFDTIILSVKSPSAFFGNMPSFHANGAISYFWIVCGFSTLCSTIWATLTYRFVGTDQQTLDKLAEMKSSMEAVQDKMPTLHQLLMPFVNFVESGTVSPAILLAQLIPAVLFPPITLLLMAGLFHLCGKLTGAARRGFSATLRAYAYSSAALLVAVIPVFGSNLSSLAHAVLFIVGLTKIHRTTYGKSVLTYLMPIFLACCCGLLSAVGLVPLMVRGLAKSFP